jgi:hypothetical protein
MRERKKTRTSSIVKTKRKRRKNMQSFFFLSWYWWEEQGKFMNYNSTKNKWAFARQFYIEIHIYMSSPSLYTCNRRTKSNLLYCREHTLTEYPTALITQLYLCAYILKQSLFEVIIQWPLFKLDSIRMTTVVIIIKRNLVKFARFCDSYHQEWT